MFSWNPPVHKRLSDVVGTTSADSIPEPQQLRELEQQRLCFSQLHQYMLKHTGSDPTSFRSNSLNTSSFEFALRQFVKVLYPAFELDKTRLVEHTISFLKHVRYPYIDAVNSKTLVPIGARHNLPQQLGMLKWLAEACELLLEDGDGDEDTIFVPNTDKDSTSQNEEVSMSSIAEHGKTVMSLLLPALSQHAFSAHTARLAGNTDVAEADDKLLADLKQIRVMCLQKMQQVMESINEVNQGLQNLEQRRNNINETTKLNRFYQGDKKKYESTLRAKIAKKEKDGSTLQEIRRRLENAREIVEELENEKNRLLRLVDSTNMTADELKELSEQLEKTNTKRADEEAKIQEIHTLINKMYNEIDEKNEHIKSLVKELNVKLSSRNMAVLEGEEVFLDFLKDENKSLESKMEDLENLQRKLAILTEKTQAKGVDIARKTGEIRLAYDELNMQMESDRSQLSIKRRELNNIMDTLRKEEQKLFEECEHSNKILYEAKCKMEDANNKRKETDLENSMKLKLKEEELLATQSPDIKYESVAEDLVEDAKRAKSQLKTIDDGFGTLLEKIKETTRDWLKTP